MCGSLCGRKAFSTAFMHSAKVNSAWTSLRLSSSALLVSIWSSYKVDNVLAWFCLHRDFAGPEDSGAGFASQSDGAVFANQPCAFADSDYWCFVFFQKLKNPFLLRFTHVLGICVRVLKMRADLKRDQTQRVERARLNNWHVL